MARNMAFPSADREVALFVEITAPRNKRKEGIRDWDAIGLHDDPSGPSGG